MKPHACFILPLLSAHTAQFFLQGDMERDLGHPVSPLMDRTKMGITKSQPGFFNVVALPLYEAFSRAFPGCGPMLEGAKGNCARWTKKADVPVTTG